MITRKHRAEIMPTKKYIYTVKAIMAQVATFLAPKVAGWHKWVPEWQNLAFFEGSKEGRCIVAYAIRTNIQCLFCTHIVDLCRKFQTYPMVTFCFDRGSV